MKDNQKRIILAGICLVLLVCLFVGVNFYSYKMKYNGKREQNLSVPLPLPNIKDVVYEDYIFVDGYEEKIMVQEYNSYLGFKFRFESTFSPVSLSDGSVMLTYKNDDNTYTKIERLIESEYYKKHEELKDVSNVDEDGYKVDYKFFRGEDLTYLMITKSVNESQDDFSLINAKIDYIINSINFDK